MPLLSGGKLTGPEVLPGRNGLRGRASRDFREFRLACHGWLIPPFGLNTGGCYD